MFCHPVLHQAFHQLSLHQSTGIYQPEKDKRIVRGIYINIEECTQYLDNYEGTYNNIQICSLIRVMMV